MQSKYLSRVALLVAMGLLAGCRQAQAPPPPTALPDKIVFIVMDTLRKDNLPFYGYPKDTAPFLTHLANRAYVFDNAFAASSWTAPATASLFTSLYPFQHGVITGIAATLSIKKSGYKLDVNRIPEEAETLGEVMKKAGYETFGIAANLNISDTQGFAQGFDFFVTMNGDPAKNVTAHIESLRPRLFAAKKYFLYLHYMDPHSPNNGWGDTFDRSLTGVAREISAYDSEILYCDTHIQRMARVFEWRKDALVIFTADHGEGFQEHGISGHGNNLFGEVLNVPLFIHPPGGLAEARRIAEPVSHLDVLPTLREMAGLPAAAEAEGLSLLPLLRREALTQEPRTLFAHLYRTPGHRGRNRETVHEAALQDGWKWVGGTDDHGLFELVRDPAEVDDRTPSRPQVARALETRYRDFKGQARKLQGVTGTLKLDEENLERLKALGYVN